MGRKLQPCSIHNIQKPDLDHLEIQARESGAYMIKVIDCRFRTIVYYVDPAIDDPDLFALFDELHLEFPDHDATLFIAVFRKEADQDGDPTPTQQKPAKYPGQPAQPGRVQPRRARPPASDQQSPGGY